MINTSSNSTPAPARAGQASFLRVATGISCKQARATTPTRAHSDCLKKASKADWFRAMASTEEDESTMIRPMKVRASVVPSTT